MAKQEFLSNFRIARNLFIHPRVEADSRQVNQQAATQTLARAAIWLTPKSVAGFNPGDFPELGPDRQKELHGAVREFLEVAKEVPANKPATTEQYANAALAFEKTLEILEPYLAAPEEGRLVAKCLRNVEFPAWVLNWDYELGSDDEGTPAIWVNIFADESSASPREFGRLAAQMTHKIRQALSKGGVHRWPYIRFRTAVEHKSL